MTISTVFAYRDDGPMSILTKWKPRRVECTKTYNHEDVPGEMFVVKYACNKQSCACAISELVCTQLIARVGVRTLSPWIVKVNSGFAASCNLKSDFPYPISAGEHFGTSLETDVENGPPIALEDLAEPWDLVLLWVADTWIGNIDRPTDGNILLKYAGNGMYHLVAADQSDCFCGADLFCSEGFPDGYLKRRTASAPQILPAAIAKTGGKQAVTRAITRVQSVITHSVVGPWIDPTGHAQKFAFRQIKGTSNNLETRNVGATQ